MLTNPEAEANVHRIILLVVSIAVVAMIALSGTATAQATGTLDITVENEIGEPIENASVFVDGRSYTNDNP